MAKHVPAPIAGVHKVDTGTAELRRDEIAGGWLLTINGAHSSHIDPDDPTTLDFEYMRQMAAVIAARHHRTDPLRALHLGAAACSLPRHLAAVYPKARQVAVEVDAELARLAREWFDLPRAPLLRIRVGDAREVVESLSDASRDVIVRDAFVSSVTPPHLTTREFTAHIRRVLAPGGMYLANCGDNRLLHRARADAATIADTFSHLAIIADPTMLRGRRTGNVVIVGSDAPVEPDAALVRTLLSDALPAKMLGDAEARRFANAAILHDEPPAG